MILQRFAEIGRNAYELTGISLAIARHAKSALVVLFATNRIPLRLTWPCNSVDSGGLHGERAKELVPKWGQIVTLLTEVMRRRPESRVFCPRWSLRAALREESAGL